MLGLNKAARLESRKQIAMAALKIFQHLRELGHRRFGVESHDPVDNMIRPRLVGWI
jgi:hypothetical protein